MPNPLNKDQINVTAGFFFDSQEGFGGDGSRPEFSGWDAFDWSELLTRINSLGPLYGE